MRSRLQWLVFVAITAVAPRSVAQDIPPTSDNITTSMEQGAGDNGDQVIYVTNRSTHRIIVTSVRLMECENVQGNCGTRRMKTRVGPGQRAMVQRVRPRSPDLAFGFRYVFTWEEEQEEGPTAKDAEKDPSLLEIDTVVISPKVVDLKVGETIDLTQVLSIEAKNRDGKVFPQVYFNPQVVLGEEAVSLDGMKLTGKSAGTAALLLRVSLTAGSVTPPRSTARVLIQVVP